MNFSIPVRDLKHRGYIFQRLDGNNRISYRKKIGYHTIWLWVSELRLHLNDYYGDTATIIQFYKDNIEHYKAQNYTEKDIEHEFLCTWLDSDTGELYEHDGWRTSRPRNKNVREIMIYIPEFEKVIEEIEFISKVEDANDECILNHCSRTRDG